MDYREAGVDISAADAAKARIKALAKSTFNPSVLTEIGSFCGLFRPQVAQYRAPGPAPPPFPPTTPRARMARERAERIAAGSPRACAEFQCPLIGGETAE